MNTTILLVILSVFTISMIITGIVLKHTPETEDFEKQKIRFAAVTFTGILVLVLLTGIMAIMDSSDKGIEVFKSILTALTPISGGIVGYFFAAKKIN